MCPPSASPQSQGGGGTHVGAAPPGGQQRPDLLRGREAPAKPPARVGVFSNKCHVSWGTRRQEPGCVGCRGPGAERGCAEGTPGSPPAHVEERLGGCWELRAPGPGRGGPSRARVAILSRGRPPSPQATQALAAPAQRLVILRSNPEQHRQAPKPVGPTPSSMFCVDTAHTGPARTAPLLQLSAGPQSWPQGGRRSMRSRPQDPVAAAGPENSGQRSWEPPGLGPSAGATVRDRKLPLVKPLLGFPDPQ